MAWARADRRGAPARAEQKGADMETRNSIAVIAFPKRMTYLREASGFHRIFGVPLKRFWESNLLGFDVLGFDQWIAPETGESTRAAVVRQYGQEAVECIERLLHPTA